MRNLFYLLLLRKELVVVVLDMWTGIDRLVCVVRVSVVRVCVCVRGVLGHESRRQCEIATAV